MPSPLRFLKGHGTENDFVVLPDPDGRLDLGPRLVRRLCDRRAGVGGDGVLRVVRTAADAEVAHLAADAEWFMDYRNADGTLAEMCGNGVRVCARYLVDAGLVPPGALRLATRSGIRDVVAPLAGDVTVDMGTPTVDPEPATVTIAGRPRRAYAVDLGNPHAVVLLDEPVDTVALESPPLVPADRFPAGANVELVNVVGPAALRMRVHERGVGETRSCGTGACAAAAAADAAVAAAGADRGWRVDVPGGRLTVTWRDRNVLLAGSAVLVAEGALCGSWVADPAETG